MRSLFTRIFVFYWLATGLVIASTVGTTSWVASQRLRAFDELEPPTLAAAAAAALHNGGRAGLVHWTRKQNRSIASPNIYVIDLSNGHDLIGRTVTQNLLRRAKLEVRALRAGRSWIFGPRYAAELTDASGGHYLLAVTAASSGPIGALGSVQVVILLVLVALAISGLVCWLVASTISRPVVQLQASARALAYGDLSTRVSREMTQRRDEIGALARDFDLMASKLRIMLASKETLMRDLSHELRSPLARLRVALGLARTQAVTSETQFLRIEREAERMDGLIGQLLRLSRLMNVELRPKLAEIDLSELLHEIVEDTRLEATGTRKTIEWTDPGVMIVRADSEMMRHALENVLRNALRFSPDDGVIRVSLTQSADQAVLLVQDQGPGVPEAELTRIFEPFYRTQTSEGTGVGLAITQQVMKLHQGTVLARNRPGGGLEVEFRLKPELTPAREEEWMLEGRK